MKMLFALLFCLISSLFALGQDSIKKEDSCKTILNIAQLDKYSLIELCMEYQRLKKINSDDCDKFESDYHNIMIKIGDTIGKSGLSKVEIENLMGKPDSIDKTYISDLGNFKNNEDIMVYCWRRWHDFLYFALINGIAKRSGWWLAFE
jgi:hypothetical protein